MQKFMRLNPSSASPSSNSSLNFLSPLRFSHNFLSLGFIHNLNIPFVRNYSTGSVMATTLHLRPLAGGSAVTVGGITRKGKSVGGNCRICRCSMESTAPFRAWSVMKESRIGSQTAWFHTDAMMGLDKVDKVFSVAARSGDGDGDGESVGVVKKDVEEKPRMNRRQRSSGGNDGGMAGAIAGSPDLLAIPGVGPRNLKKLVEKGIGGVAELKQIYKDKDSYC